MLPRMEELIVKVDGTTIIVTMPGTSFQATYFKEPDGPGIQQDLSMTKDSDAALTTREFETLAWEAANAKARELGWIV